MACSSVWRWCVARRRYEPNPDRSSRDWVARSGVAPTCGPPKTIGTSHNPFTARATETDHACVTLYDVNATTSGRVATIRSAVSSGLGSSSRASSAESVPVPDENGRASVHDRW